MPHRGWTFVGDEDLGEPSKLCEMCESQDVRYVQYLEHPDYPETLAVGCVCAERMEEDYVNPRKRERRLQNIAKRRANWPKRNWQISQKGNSYLNTDGFNLTVFETHDEEGSFWALTVTNRSTAASKRGKGRYTSKQAAKSAAFDALIWAIENLTATPPETST